MPEQRVDDDDDDAPRPVPSRTPARRRHLRAGRVAFALLVVVIAVLAWIPGRQFPAPNSHDKLNHLLAFTTLMAVGWRVFPAQRLRALAGLFAFGVLIELVQLGVPGRSAEFGDLLADALGLGLGAALGALLDRR
ncbi:VanZ family protein [Piscinibacter sakaiensis]|uniref:VanZ family protein n=1 Tax=Piscinibacter sakaiensis TaxID=1547922 RepID=UPI003727801C